MEPTATFPDTALIDKLGSEGLPIRLVFWRATQQRVKHRNPLFNKDTGVTPLLMAPDQLHALNLGSLNKFAQELLWTMLWNSVWADRLQQAQGAWLHLSILAIRGEVKEWETAFHMANPLHKQTIIQKLQEGHIGKPTSRCLKLKAAESKYLFLYLLAKLEKVWTQLHRGQLWLQAARAMDDLLKKLSGMPLKPSEVQEQDRMRQIATTSVNAIAVKIKTMWNWT